METQEQKEQWQLADEEVQRKLPPGVKLVRSLRGHTGWIGRVAWSADGKLLASPSQDKTTRIWHVDTGECLRVLTGYGNSANCAAFDPASRTLAVSAADRTCKLWEVPTGQLIRTLRLR